MVAAPAANAEDPLRDGGRFEVLARINARELEIENLLLEARRIAAGRLLEARRTAAAVVEGHEQEAAGAAARAGAEILARARGQAEAIRAAGAGRAAAIRNMSSERIDQAAERLLVLLLPAPPQEGPGS